MSYKKALWILPLLVLLGGCAKSSRNMFYQLNKQGQIDQKSLERILWENALPPEGEISNTMVLSGDYASYHVIQIRTQEQPHVHERHDLAVTVRSGGGTLFIAGDSTRVGAGSTVFIPRGTPHYFVNASPQVPSVAFAVFSPPFDGKDTLFIDREKMKGYLRLD